jgi:hypothetical protein
MIICNDRKRIMYYYTGWPGSTHDNRVWRNCKVFRDRMNYFDFGEYLLGDSAYSKSTIMVQAFKKHALTAELPGTKEFFNTMLAHVCISSEHCIGILNKGWFPCLKRKNIKLKDGEKEVKELVDLIGACTVLHNLLIDYDKNDIPSEWYNEIQNFIDWSLYDEEEESIPEIDKEGGDRRETVYHSIINNYFMI